MAVFMSGAAPRPRLASWGAPWEPPWSSPEVWLEQSSPKGKEGIRRDMERIHSFERRGRNRKNVNFHNEHIAK